MNDRPTTLSFGSLTSDRDHPIDETMETTMLELAAQPIELEAPRLRVGLASAPLAGSLGLLALGPLCSEQLVTSERARMARCRSDGLARFFWRTENGYRRVVSLLPRVVACLANLPVRHVGVFRHDGGHYEGRDCGYGRNFRSCLVISVRTSEGFATEERKPQMAIMHRCEAQQQGAVLVEQI